MLNGYITYNSEENTIEEKLYEDVDPIISKESNDTLLDEDENIIKFYLNLCKVSSI